MTEDKQDASIELLEVFHQEYFLTGWVSAMKYYDGQLDERKQKILKAIVVDYVKTAEPVGSEFLAIRYGFEVKPATIRNEMARMSEMGYLRQPHTSAGRIPSDMGYRFYVDKLMTPQGLPDKEAHSVRADLQTTDPDVEHIINQTCRILASLTRHTSIATEPATDDTQLRHVTLSTLGNKKMLLVAMFSNGCVEHRILDVSIEMDQGRAVRLSNALTLQLAGRTMQALSACSIFEVPQEMAFCREVYELAVRTIVQIAKSFADRKVYLEGTNYVLKQPEFKSVDKLEQLMTAFEHRKLLYEVLSNALLGPDVTIIIGEENPLSQMWETSVVASSYTIGDRVAGTIAVVGPTRMDYRRAVSAVRFMAQNLSELLTSVSGN